MIYCELRSDIDILNDLDEAKRVFLVGCPTCANASLYIQKAAENTAMLILTPTGYRAVSMEEEIARLTHVLADKGLDVDSWIGKYPTVSLCLLNERTRKKLSEKSQDFETVITLCCDAGTNSIKGILSGKRVITAMNAIGLTTAVTKSKMMFAKLYVDKSTVDIMRFTLDTQARS